MTDLSPQEAIIECFEEWEGEEMPPLEVDAVLDCKDKYRVRIGLPRRDGTILRMYSPVTLDIEKAKALVDFVTDSIREEASARGLDCNCEGGWNQ